MSSVTFAELNLIEPLLKALSAEEYTTPTPIQAQAIPHLLAGRDLLGCAQTGTGKTAAFALPILQHLDSNRRAAAPRSPRVLVLSPTRELAAQIAASFATYGRHIHFRHTTVYGGVGQHPQVKALTRGVHVLVATPGRLLDLTEQGFIRYDEIEMFVLDEADRMFDMGFLPDLRRIIAKLPKTRQSLFFSATMPQNIAALARELLTDPVRVTVTPPATTVERIDQRVIHVAHDNKRELLSTILAGEEVKRCLVFTRTKRGADRLAKQLQRGGVTADAIHGDKSQSARDKALRAFKAGQVRVLVATDLAARGIDVDGISHVVNYELPYDTESYVHRIGRTARAGAEGIAISFCDPAERGLLRDIERLVRRSLRVDASHGFTPPPPTPRPAAPRPNTGRPQNRPAQGRPTQGRPAQGRPAQGQPAQGLKGPTRRKKTMQRAW